MEWIELTKENLEREHICCAISSGKDGQAACKKAWLDRRLEEGLVFRKADARGKCIIEYLPGERAWVPVEAADLMWIDCLWVAGQLAGQGQARALLDACIQDGRARGRRGLAILSSDKTRGFLADPAFLRHMGFRQADEADPYFRLYWLPLAEDAQPPRFRPCVGRTEGMGDGFTLLYTHQCPFTAKYVPLLRELAAKGGVPLETALLDTAEKARSAPSPFTAYSLFYRGRFVTHEILSEKKWDKLLGELERED